MLKPKSVEVQPGDRFTKTVDPNGRIWQIVELWIAVDGILHARLRSCDQQASLITIAAGVLSDPSFWRPVRER